MPFLNKLRIIGLNDPKPEGSAGFGNIDTSFGGMTKDFLTYQNRIFEAQINPAYISRSLGIKYCDPSEFGSDKTEYQFKGVKGEELELEFVLDGTGVVKNNAVVLDPVSAIVNNIPRNPVTDQAYVSLKVAQLQTTVYGFLDETHRPSFLVVNYGKFVFMGILKNMDVKYNLFSSVGMPLRARVKLKLLSHKSKEKQASLLSLLSPDLTRQHTVVAGDNILRISEKAYDDQRYYIEVAKANRLTNFRKIVAGDVLTLPPIDKASTL